LGVQSINLSYVLLPLFILVHTDTSV